MPFDLKHETKTELLHSSKQSLLRFILADNNGQNPQINAILKNPIVFREAFAVFNSIVNFDVSFQLRNNNSYEAWLRQNNLACELLKRRTRKLHNVEFDANKAELKKFMKENKRSLLPYQKAQKRYLRYLYQKYLEKFLVMEPWLSVHSDEVFFETFSYSQKLYCRLSVDVDLLENIKNQKYGTTMFSYSTNFSEAIEKIRDYKQTHISVGLNKEDPVSAHIDLGTIPPERDYIRGLLQMNTAMNLSFIQIDLQPIDLHNLSYLLTKRKKLTEASAIRYELIPGEKVKIILEPENKILECSLSVYDGAKSLNIRHVLREEIKLLSRLVPQIEKLSVFLYDSVSPVFYLARMGEINLTLGLSAWIAGDWTRKGAIDLLRPNSNAAVDDFSRVRILKEVSENRITTAESISQKLKMPHDVVLSALQSFAQEGLVFYDFNKNKYRYRKLFDLDIDASQYRFADEIEAKARYFISQNSVQIDNLDNLNNQLHIAGTVRDKAIEYQPEIVIDQNNRMISASCFCHYYASHKLNLGPCEHMLAIRLKSQDRQSEPTARPELTK